MCFMYICQRTGSFVVHCGDISIRTLIIVETDGNYIWFAHHTNELLTTYDKWITHYYIEWCHYFRVFADSIDLRSIPQHSPPPFRKPMSLGARKLQSTPQGFMQSPMQLLRRYRHPIFMVTGLAVVVALFITNAIIASQRHSDSRKRASNSTTMIHPVIGSSDIMNSTLE